jgi:hypothetical protein
MERQNSTPPPETPQLLSALGEQERLRIRVEEIYREEVRKEITKPKTLSGRLLAFLNSPFGIYVLSSVLVAGVTYVYSQHKETLEKERSKQEELTKLADEIAFRERQLDDVLRLAEDASTTLTNSASTVPELDNAARTKSYRVHCEEVAAVVKAGGLVSPPGDLHDEFDYRDIILSSRMLLYRQGYKSPEYKFMNLTDLAMKKWKLKQPAGKQVSTDDVKQLETALKALDASGYAVESHALQWAGEYYGTGAAITDPRKFAELMTPLLNDVRKGFGVIQHNRLLLGE